MTPVPSQRDAFFLGEAAERRFCLVTRPAGPPIGSLLFVHPFAEELNRSRRMVALAAQAFAQQGWTVFQMDLHGCGDSEGDFADASWESWLSDLDRAHAWLAEHQPGPVALWTLRAGALLASSWLARTAHTLPWLAWQPVFAGAPYLTQFLRIRLGADLAVSAKSGNVLAELRAALKAGESVSVGGYWLSAALAQGVESSSFVLPPDRPTRLCLLEVSSGDEAELTPAASNWLNKARAAGHDCHAEVASGNKFWQSTEIETAMGLVAPSQRALQAWSA